MRLLSFVFLINASVESFSEATVDSDFFKKQKLVARVRLVESRELAYDYKTYTVPCGKNHVAKVIKSYGNELKGDLRFSSTIPLTVGLEYFVFLNDESNTAEALKSHLSRIDYGDGKEAKLLNECFSKLNPQHVDYSNIFTIDLYPGMDVTGEWLKVYDKQHTFPDDVKVVDGFVDSDGEYRVVEWISFEKMFKN